MARKLVVCFDGTGDTPDKDGNVYDEIDSETNVVHLFRAIKGESCGTAVGGCTSEQACTAPVKRKKESDACYSPKNPGLPWLEPGDQNPV